MERGRQGARLCDAGEQQLRRAGGLGRLEVVAGLNVASADASHLKESSATVELTIAPSPSVATRDDFERVTIEFNHAELSDFFLKMDQVQRQLDSLSES